MIDSFGTRLRDLRVEKGLSQTDLAERSGLSQNAISQWEAGNREPLWSNVQSLAAALGVDCTAFQSTAPVVAEAEDERSQGKRK